MEKKVTDERTNRLRGLTPPALDKDVHVDIDIALNVDVDVDVLCKYFLGS